MGKPITCYRPSEHVCHYTHKVFSFSKNNRSKPVCYENLLKRETIINNG